jgi:hypothetical protein
MDPLNQGCVDNHSDEKWKCLMAQYLIPHIDIPIYFLQSLYD